MEKEHKLVDKCCCYVCGVEGYKELLVDCIQCSQLFIHKYCLGIVPGSLQDKQGIDWVCYYCSEPSISSETSDQTSVLTSDCECKLMVLVEEQPKPLCTLFPDGYIAKSEIAEPVEIMRGVVLLVSPSGETVMMYDESSLWEGFPGFGTLARFVSSDMVRTKVVGTKRKRELEKFDLGGFRRSPRFTRRKLMHKSKGVLAY